MKKICLAALTACFCLCGCQMEEIYDGSNESVSDAVEFYASIEDEGLTKTVLDEHNNIRWSEGDQIVIFKKTTLGTKYQVKETSVGKTTGSFSPVSSTNTGDDFTSGNGIEHNVAFYPYSESVEAERYESDYRLYLDLPSEQNYAAESFGNGTFPMAAVSETTNLTFRNVCGGLKLQLKGNSKVVSIKVEGNNDEKLSGAASMIASADSEVSPIITMTDEASTSVILNCGDGVQLSDEEATEFIISLPPTEFEKGFTVTVTDIYGGVFKKETSKANTVIRSSILKMPEVEVSMEYAEVPDFQIWYTSTKKVELNESTNFGASILSHEWDKATGKGEITFDSPVTTIGESAFYNVSALKAVYLPESIKSIGDKAFGKCSNLKEVNIPAGVSEMGKYVFEECNSLPVKDNIIYADTYLVKIYDKSRHALSDIIREGTRWIGESAFYNYDNMISVVIPEGVLKIGEYAFAFCDELDKVTVPSSLKVIGSSAFYDCRKLATVYISDLTAWCNIEFNDRLLSSYVSARLVLNGREITDLVIPEGITSIGKSTFADCSSLKRVTIPEHVTSIGNSAFNRCQNLETVTIQGGVTDMGSSVFASCEKLKSVTLGNGVTMIGKSAFQQCEALTEITIPGSVAKIEQGAFSWCNSLTSVTLPEGLKSIGKSAFSNCSRLTDVSLPNTVESIGQFAFYYSTALTSITIPYSVSSIGKSAFLDCRSLKEVNCMPVDPPALEATVFDSNASNRKIYVPAKSLERYKAAENWSSYANYILSMSGNDSENLSKDGTANCYIVSKLGSYKFTPTKGNSSESVGEIASAEVLWETFGTDVTPNVGDVIKNVEYAEGVINFDTPNVFREGNAVIAAKDASGNILWSWHIWFTDQPQSQAYYNNAGTVMDRNLGATSAIPGDVGALGLLYQWGRKDPFLGSSSISSSTVAASTITWPSSVYSNSTTGNIAYAVAHPTTYISYNAYNDDWYYVGTNTTDDTRWRKSAYAKAVYDPCPSGWRVPDYSLWSEIIESPQKSPVYDNENNGIDFAGIFGSGSTIWYPASGYLHADGGRLYSAGSLGYYWSVSPNSYLAYSLRFNSNGFLTPSVYEYRSTGRAVRCVQVTD